jgi:hypothetical protein
MAHPQKIRLQIPILEATNRNDPAHLLKFFAWIEKLEVYLRSYGLWEVVKGKDNGPEAPPVKNPTDEQMNRVHLKQL